MRQFLKSWLIGFIFWQETPWLGLTYDNDKLQDGAGAQLHRIYAIYALSRLLKVKYIHSPLKRIGNQGLIALENDSEDPELIDRYNRIFTLPSDGIVPDQVSVINVDVLHFKDLWRIRSNSIRNKTFTLIRCRSPFHVQEMKPDSYKYVRSVTPFKSSPGARSVLRLAIHVRRGDAHIGTTNRILPNHYYINLAKKIVAILEGWNLKYVIELYTEIPSKTFPITPRSRGIDGRISQPVVMNQGIDQIQDFDSLPHLEKFFNFDAVQSLENLATSDILIISRSSFSFLAAILNPRAVVFYYDFWHRAPSDWIETTLAGDFSTKLFADRFWAQHPGNRGPFPATDINADGRASE